MASVHRVKREVFDTSRHTNIDPKGFVRQVDVYRATECGLYMARGADHSRFGYLESWLLPGVGLRANTFHFRPGVIARQDYYFDVADITRDPASGCWETRDLYIDLVTRVGEPVEVQDIDELTAATAAGYLSPEDAARAVTTAVDAVTGIARYNNDPMAWLRSRGAELSWAEQVELSPATD